MLAESGGIDPHAVAGTIRFQNSAGHLADSLPMLVVTTGLEPASCAFGRRGSSSWATW
jgi:hypothetical protein